MFNHGGLFDLPLSQLELEKLSALWQGRAEFTLAVAGLLKETLKRYIGTQGNTSLSNPRQPYSCL